MAPSDDDRLPRPTRRGTTASHATKTSTISDGGLPLDVVTDNVVADLRSKWMTGGYLAGTRTVKPTSSRKTLANRLSVLSSMLHTTVESLVEAPGIEP